MAVHPPPAPGRIWSHTVLQLQTANHQSPCTCSGHLASPIRKWALRLSPTRRREVRFQTGGSYLCSDPGPPPNGGQGECPGSEAKVFPASEVAKGMECVSV